MASSKRADESLSRPLSARRLGMHHQTAPRDTLRRPPRFDWPSSVFDSDAAWFFRRHAAAAVTAPPNLHHSITFSPRRKYRYKEEKCPRNPRNKSLLCLTSPKVTLDQMAPAYLRRDRRALPSLIPLVNSKRVAGNRYRRSCMMRDGLGDLPI